MHGKSHCDWNEVNGWIIWISKIGSWVFNKTTEKKEFSAVSLHGDITFEMMR